MTLLSEVAEINPRLSAALVDDDRVSFLGMADVSELGKTSLGTERPYSSVKKGFTSFLNGDILVAKITPCFENGKIAQAEVAHPYAFGSTEFHVIRVQPDAADPRYLLHMLRSPRVRASGERRMTGSAGQKRVPKAFLEALDIPLPPLQDQRRIAAILDQADELRTTRRSAIALVDSLMGALFTSMFGDPRAASPWSVKLSDVARIRSGSTPDRKRPDYFGGGIPWIKTTEVHGDRILSTGESVSEAGQNSARLQVFPADSIVIAMYGQGKTRGQSAVLGIDATVNQACAVILPSERFHVDFMAQQLRLSYKRLRAKAQGGNQANLNLQLVGDLDVLVPPIALQNLFAVNATSLRELRNLHSTALSKLDELFASLQHRALTGQL